MNFPPWASWMRFLRALVWASVLMSLTCGTAIGRQDSHDRLLRSIAHALVTNNQAALQGLLTKKNVRRLDSAERCDLMIGLIEHGRLTGLAAAVRGGVDPNTPLRFDREGEWISMTPLNFALGTHDDAAVALLLIELGADINRMSVDDNPPLLTAVSRQVLPVVKRLLELGANPNATERLIQMTSLMVAAGNRGNHSRALEIAQLLLEQGAEINAESSTGHTAVMFAARAKNQALVAWLLEHGADASRIAANGANPNTSMNNATADQGMSRLSDLLNSLDR